MKGRKNIPFATSLALILFACSSDQKPALQITSSAWKDFSQPQRQRALDELAASCRLPQRTLVALGGDEVALQLQPTAKFNDVDCLLRKVNPLMKFMKVGFIGNEAFAKEGQ